MLKAGVMLFAFEFALLALVGCSMQLDLSSLDAGDWVVTVHGPDGGLQDSALQTGSGLDATVDDATIGCQAPIDSGSQDSSDAGIDASDAAIVDAACAVCSCPTIDASAPPAAKYPMFPGFQSDPPLLRVLHDGDSRPFGYSTLSDPDSPPNPDGGTALDGIPYAAMTGALLGSRVQTFDLGRSSMIVSTMNTDADFAAHIAPYITATPPTVVVVMAGVNDLHSGASPSTVYANLSGYCARVRAAGAKVIILGDPDALASVGETASAAYRTLESGSVPSVADGYIDPGAPFEFSLSAPRFDAGTWGAFYIDGLHPNQNGHTFLTFQLITTLSSFVPSP